MGRGMNMDGPPSFSLSVTAEGTDVVVRAAGELDLASAPALERALNRVAPPASGRVVLDLRELSFTDAAGLRVLVAASRRLGERLVVCGPRPPVRQLLEVTRLDHLVLRRADPASDVPAGNLAYVRRLWEGFASGGLERLAEMVPGDAEWHPLNGGGRVLRGTRGLRAMWSTGGLPTSFAALGDDVLVGTRRADNRAEWWLFWFDGPRLRGAAVFEHQAEAVGAHCLRMAS